MSAETIETLAYFFAGLALSSILLGFLKFLFGVPKQLRRIADALEVMGMEDDDDV